MLSNLQVLLQGSWLVQKVTVPSVPKWMLLHQMKKEDQTGGSPYNCVKNRKICQGILHHDAGYLFYFTILKLNRGVPNDLYTNTQKGTMASTALADSIPPRSMILSAFQLKLSARNFLTLFLASASLPQINRLWSALFTSLASTINL